jgi:hypothetical protein
MKSKMPTYTPLRTQYVFDLSGVKSKPYAAILAMQRQWETFERVENYDDIIYQRFSVGDRSQTYYTFRNREELLDYRSGQELHVLRYPWLPLSTFASIRDRPMPDVAITAKPPSYSAGTTPRNLLLSTPMTASERLAMEADMTIYAHVSTFNATHYFQYNFPSDDEKMAYHRAERRIRMGGTS